MQVQAKKQLLALLLAASFAVIPFVSFSENINSLDTNAVNNSGLPSLSPTPGRNAESSALRGRVATIPKGTTLLIKLDQPISSFSSNLGEAVGATLENDVFVNDAVLLPAGSQIQGQVANVSRSGHLGKHGEIDVKFFSVKTPDGVVIPITGHIVTQDNSGILRGNSYAVDILKGIGVAGAATGIGAVAGTAFGGLLGVAGSGAVFGTAVGGLGGVTYAATRRGKDVVIPSGSRMSIIISQPVTVNQ